MINSISNVNTSYNTKQVKNTKQQAKEEKIKAKENDGVVYEHTEEKVSEQDKKTSQYKEKREIENMIKQAELQTKNFETLVSSVFSKQANKVDLVKKAESGNLKDFYENLTVDAKTIAQAKKDISEDGYYGVKQTSERIVDFAKAVSGGNQNKLQEMRDAVEKGFKQAERMWGGELPDISKQTYDAVMSKFDEMQGIKTEEKE